MRTLTQPLNMSPGGIPPVIHVSQYDSDFTIVFTLFSTVGDFTIESGTTAMVRGTKSSGTGYSADAAINISAKTVTVTGNAQMTAAAGQNIFEIVLKKNNKEISSKNFILLCERAALDADTITDESVLKELNAIIEGAETATQAAEEAEDAADRAEAAAQSLVIDQIPTQGSANAVSSGGVYDELADVKSDLRQKTGLSEDAKIALLDCFKHVAWIDEHGQTYYDSLYDALYPDTGLVRITAVFEQGTLAVYPETPLNDLKPYLTVTGFYKDGTSGRITGYALSGSLTVGTSTITVTKDNKTATFNVTVTQDPALVYELPSGTDISTHAIDTDVPVFGADDDFTILIKAHIFELPSDNTTKYLMNQGYLSSGTLRLGVIYNNNLLSYISNVMYSDGTTNITITETYESDIMYVVRIENKIATKMLYVDGERLVNKTEDISSYLSSKVFTGDYIISAFDNASATDGLFPGIVNLLKIYNKALQDSDIESIMGIQM